MEEEDLGPLEFNWNVCLPGQMFVYSPDDVDFILDTVITHQKPLCTREYKFTPANVIFLASRYAYHYSSTEALAELLEKTISKISYIITVRIPQFTK